MSTITTLSRLSIGSPGCELDVDTLASLMHHASRKDQLDSGKNVEVPDCILKTLPGKWELVSFDEFPELKTINNRDTGYNGYVYRNRLFFI